MMPAGVAIEMAEKPAEAIAEDEDKDAPFSKVDNENAKKGADEPVTG